MDVRIILLIFAFISTQFLVDADFLFNQLPPTAEQFKARGLKCMPGRTVISIEEKKMSAQEIGSYENMRRTHMNAEAKDETCRICVCSVEGKDEYCSKRPARNVNECIRMAILKKKMESNLPFGHERSLAFRIRRDYIWHYDEIPYEPKASCKRGASYYSNNVNANNTDIDVPSDIDSLLDYSNKDICYYCVCSTNGRHAGCISRSSWYCEYYRIIRKPDAARNRYHDLFKQDRPAYFRTLSYRLRRNMDEGIVAFMDIVGGDNIDSKCVPFVSQYSDCSEANLCSGCNRCVCNADGEWNCESVFECPIEDDNSLSDRDSVSTSLDALYAEIKNKKKKPRVLVPPPPPAEDELIVPDVKYYEEDFTSYVSRQKREANPLPQDDKNHTIHFFNTVDEINQDILKGTNNSGTIKAVKVNVKQSPKLSRRFTNNVNKTSLKDLNIQLNPQEYDSHIAENKIDLDLINKNYMDNMNYTQLSKNKDLSNLVVNELKRGTEVIGDKNVSPMSNITFTSENDTLTAMTLIAGNLLNKLWDMEKETSDNSIDIETLKHKKINDLLELFKEPLSIRQETFLKNALEKLSDTLNKNKNVKNVSLCETITVSDGFSNEEINKKYFKESGNDTKCNKEQLSKEIDVKRHNKEEKTVSTQVVSRLNNVLSLMQKFEQLKKNLTDYKNQISNADMPNREVNTQNKQIDSENSSMHLFNNLLEKITDLLTPSNGSKKFTKKLSNLHQFRKDDLGKKIIKNKFHIDVGKNNLTVKDKLLLDYLDHIENNPNCLLSEKNHRSNEKQTNIEGNILYNLSEFFKIKSLIDLVKLTKNERSSKTPESSTTEAVQTTKLAKVLDFSKKNLTDKSQNLNKTKERLKSHLRAIIDDLIELQNENDPKSLSKMNILDALPCIYKMLNTDRVQNDVASLKKADTDPLIKIRTLIDSLKIEFTPSIPYRRNNVLPTERLKSAIIWERIVKNINSLQKTMRRTSNFKKAKSYNELKNLMENVEAVGNSYKNFALLSVTPPQKKLMLLKTLEADTRQKALVLKSIRDSINNLKNLPIDKQNELKEFVDNIESNINLSSKVLKNVEKTKPTSNIKDMVEILPSNTNGYKQGWGNLLEATNIDHLNKKRFKLTRDQIMSKLIENRIKYYITSKDETGTNINDVNYNIAKKILRYLQEGNIEIAKELYNVFVSNNTDETTRRKESEAVINVNGKRPLLLALKEPLVKFDDQTKDVQINKPDILLRQLLNFKNINLK